MLKNISDKLRHFFHVVSNVRPIIWICLYVVLIPIFAVIYGWLPDGQFRVPDGAGTDYGSWLYYSIVTITTLGFGDYTPAHAMAQCVTAVEVMCGLLILGFFLNAVGSMKSEIDVETELEKQRRLHAASEREKLLKNIPVILHKLNLYLSYCFAVTTPKDKRGEEESYNPDFRFVDMKDIYQPSDIGADRSMRPAVDGLISCADHTSLFLDSLQTRVDLTLWPKVLEDCFAFVAACQLFGSAETLKDWPRSEMSRDTTLTQQSAEEKISKAIAGWHGEGETPKEAPLAPAVDLYRFVKETAKLARNLETTLTEISNGGGIGE